MQKNILVALGMVVALVSYSFAGVDAVNMVYSDAADGAEPHKVTDLLIDFGGQYTGSQLLVTLTSGSVFQQSPFGATGAPSDALLGAFADLKWDSFVTQGGATTDASDGAVGIGGGAVNLGGAAGSQWDAAGLNQAWNPAPGVTIMDQTDFMVARVTLTPDAAGTWRYLGSAGGVFGIIGDAQYGDVNLSNGMDGLVVGGQLVLVPEPATISLIGLALLGLVGLRRRS